MRRVVFSAQSRRDLTEIWDHIAADSIRAADAIVAEVSDAARSLADMPGIGHVRADVKDPRYRFWAVRKYVMAYRHTSRTLTVVRVIHGARNFRRIFRSRK